MDRRAAAWHALERPWFYLGRSLPGVLDVATLAGAGGRTAVAFTSAAGAWPLLRVAPPGAELQGIAADDLRAKEEWLRAVLDQGATRLIFDALPADEGDPGLSADSALAYVLSMKRATACL